MNILNIAIAAEFDLCEKLAEFLEHSSLEIEHLSIIEIYPFNEEQGVRFNNRSVAQLSINEIDWSDFNYVLFAGDISHALHLAQAAEAGCVVVDIKGICSTLSDVPLIVPTINNAQLIELRQRNIVSLPNPQITQLALAIADLVKQHEFHQIIVTSLLPASYDSSNTINQLAGQTAKLLNGLPIDEQQQRLAFDVFPINTANLNIQLQKIFPQLNNVVFHQVRVPVFYGISQVVTMLSHYELDNEILLTQWQKNKLLQYEKNLITPVTNGEKESDEYDIKLHIGQLTPVEHGIEFWTVADDQRFILALMAVKLVELIHQNSD